ncbi:MAG: aminoacetone oxidase family FAD-binding enzyme [Victivallales bacterium]|nr:aminoacetone oxidase family FAD-binding enzyme [Victivallales bacterium]
MSLDCELIIIGAGAAGLFAACEAADAGIPAVLVERRHRPGLKLLMCGNNRCNLSHAGSAADLLRDYGSPVADFLAPAVNAFPPSALGRRMAQLGVSTKLIGSRVYPESERGDDVLHAFTDHLRDAEMPVIYNCPVRRIVREDGKFVLECGGIRLSAPRVILATGGCSYPKTGSAGDGYRFAEELGLAVEEPRAGLVGVELEADHPLCRLEVPSAEVSDITATAPGMPTFRGNLLVENGCLRGKAVFDLTRWAARHRQEIREVTLDLLPERTAAQIRRNAAAAPNGRPATTLNAAGMPPMLAAALAEIPGMTPEMLKSLHLAPVQCRPLKEAIVTVGGIALSEIDSRTMEARNLPGFHVVGEALDVDGPTGGYNLHAAFATARAAVAAIAAQCGNEKPAPKREDERRQNGRPRRENDRKPNAPQHRNDAPKNGQLKTRRDNNAWGKGIWEGRTIRRDAPKKSSGREG